MSRRLKVACPEYGGTLELYLINSTKDEWEAAWRPLQDERVITDLVTYITKEVLDHALCGWTAPLVKALGTPPDGSLIKLPQVCTHKDSMPCPIYDPARCTPRAKKMNTCFQPLGVKGDEALQLASEVIRYWRERVYVLVVEES